MKLRADSGFIVPFQSHFTFSIALSRHIGYILEAFTGGSWSVVQTGSASLSFVPDIEFAQQVHQSVIPEFIRSDSTPGKWVVCIYSEVSKGGILLRAFAFDPIEETCEQRVDFIRSAEQTEGPLLLAQQLMTFVPLPMSSDYDRQTKRILQICKHRREELWLSIGVHFAQEANFAVARSFWSNVLNTISKTSFHALTNIGQSYSDEQNWEEAEEWLSLAIDGCPKEGQRYIALYNRGIARKNMGDSESAVADYRACLTSKPDFGLAYVNIGATLLDSGRSREAGPWFRKGLELRTDSSAALGDTKQLCVKNLKKMGKEV
jgi:tetratricopeptide (TPR) repeat protein